MKLEGKLELTWVGKNEEIKLEPRILVEDKSKSYGDPNTENMLIHGDNLLALKALEKDFAGKIKCIYIDPPYNTGAAFDLYDDNVEHSIWLNLMCERLKILRTLLKEEGVIFIQIDGNEMHYLKIVADEVFGRKNYLSTITCKVKAPSGVASGSQMVFDCSEYILVYAKDKSQMTYVDINEDAEIVDERSKTADFYTYILENFSFENMELIKEFDGEKIYKIDPMNYKISKMDNLSSKSYYDNYDKIFRTAALSGGREKIVKAHLDTIPNSSASLFVYEHIPTKGKRTGQVCHDLIYKNGGVLMLKDFAIKNIKEKTVIKQQHITSIFYNDWWQGIAKEGNIELKNGKKPEILIKTILDMTTEAGDFVLDSFAGSGTTAAVAHKMHRKWITIELGNHAYTHCKVRMDKVVDGEQSGISKITNWTGGGGYKFYELAESLLVKNDKLPIYQINPNYTFEMMCEAICKIEGFDYKTEGSFHGKSSENRFIHITTEFVNAEYIKNLSKELSEKQSLLIYSTKFATDLRLPDNIVVKKIPKDLLKKCKFESEVR